MEEPLEPLCERFFRETVRYWQGWVKHCNVPPSYQGEVIRSALALKLHCFEDTGAIVAALTTSIPEAKGVGRTWDYRYCWLRDAYYTLGAFRLLGHFEEREQFLQFLLNVASSAPELDLGAALPNRRQQRLREHVLPNWAGFLGEQPVRIGNAAARAQATRRLRRDGPRPHASLPRRPVSRPGDAAVLDLVTRLARAAPSPSPDSPTRGSGSTGASGARRLSAP